MTSLAELRKGWDRAAIEDPMFNILSLPEHANGGWPEDEFFDSGAAEVGGLIDRLVAVNPQLSFRRALDFGCGIGRLTRALTGWFDAVDAVDISAEMIDQAIALGTDARFLVNEKPDLKLLGRYRYDLIYSSITLQHMDSGLQRGYVSEFVRLLRKRGVAVFQIPEADMPNHKPWLAMHGTPRAEVERWVTKAGGRVRDIDPRPEGNCASCTYTVTR